MTQKVNNNNNFKMLGLHNKVQETSEWCHLEFNDFEVMFINGSTGHCWTLASNTILFRNTLV
jgi:hypothetical protein